MIGLSPIAAGSIGGEMPMSPLIGEPLLVAAPENRSRPPRDGTINRPERRPSARPMRP